MSDDQLVDKLVNACWRGGASNSGLRIDPMADAERQAAQEWRAAVKTRLAALVADNARLAAENAQLREQIAGHCERIAKQSDALGRKAEKRPNMPEGVITLNEARRQSRCRVCGKPILTPAGKPVSWKDEFRRMVYPVNIVLNFGAEFAHGECVAEGA